MKNFLLLFLGGMLSCSQANTPTESINFLGEGIAANEKVVYDPEFEAYLNSLNVILLPFNDNQCDKYDKKNKKYKQEIFKKYKLERTEMPIGVLLKEGNVVVVLESYISEISPFTLAFVSYDKQGNKIDSLLDFYHDTEYGEEDSDHFSQSVFVGSKGTIVIPDFKQWAEYEMETIDSLLVYEVSAQGVFLKKSGSVADESAKSKIANAYKSWVEDKVKVGQYWYEKDYNAYYKEFDKIEDYDKYMEKCRNGLSDEIESVYGDINQDGVLDCAIKVRELHCTHGDAFMHSKITLFVISKGNTYTVTEAPDENMIELLGNSGYISEILRSGEIVGVGRNMDEMEIDDEWVTIFKYENSSLSKLWDTNKKG